MSYIVSRDLVDIHPESSVYKLIDKLDDEIIRRYQEGWARDEYGQDWTIVKVQNYCKENNRPFSAPYPSSFDALLILHDMIKNGEFYGII